MSTTQSPSGFLEAVNWENYSHYRPKYPPSLTELILTHHRTRGNASFHLAHDVGSGSGIFAQTLAQHFEHVHVSDSNPTFVQQARANFDQKPFIACTDERRRVQLTFSAMPAEKAHEVAAGGSVDLVSLMQCAHWTEQDVVVGSVARSLAPGGTLVVVQINPAPRVVGNEKVAEAVRKLFVFWGRRVLDARGGEESLMGKRYLPQGNGGVEGIHLPDGLFDPDKTRRIEINVHGRGVAPHAIPGLESLVATPRANPQDMRIEYTSDNPEGKGWRYEVEAEWFRGVIGTLDEGRNLHQYKERLVEVEELVRETSMNERVVIEWTVAVLLATRIQA